PATAAPEAAQPEWAAPSTEAAAEELQPEWVTPAEEAAPAQPEWATPAAEAAHTATTEEAAQSEWATPVEELPADAAQPEWATPAAEAAPEWAATEEPAASDWNTPATETPSAGWDASSADATATPEWAADSTEAAPAAEELQPEWVTPEAEPVAAAPAEEWAEAPLEEAPLADASTPEWSSQPAAPAEAVQADWSDAPVEVEPMVEDAPAQPSAAAAFEDVPWQQEPDAEPEAQPWATRGAQAWQADGSPFGAQIQELSEPEPSVDVSMDAPLPAPSEVEELAVDLEPEQEVAEIDLMEEAVVPPPAAIAPPPPPPAVMAVPTVTAPTPASRLSSVSAPPPAPAIAPAVRASVVAPVAMPQVASVSNHVTATREPLFSTPAVEDASSPITSFVEGEHRVIIHTIEGQVKRGTIRDADLLDEVISLEQQSGFAPEQISGKRVKAIFFMLPTGARQPQAEGQKIRVTFNDGRQVAGFSQDFKNPHPGFFVIPADQRTNTARIFIYRASVQAVAEG
ncbi:MAG TPA: hypothetical protein VE153_12025, partial [Myxococcus sp.]|nr:hypothetical protein [Myxococcus sp.]